MRLAEAVFVRRGLDAPSLGVLVWYAAMQLQERIEWRIPGAKRWVFSHRKATCPSPLSTAATEGNAFS